MGRRKIAIQAIEESKIKYNTFNKRKNGLIKKAAELSMLCNVKMLLAFEDLHGNLVQYSTHGIFDPKQYFSSSKMHKYYEFTSKNYPNFFKGMQSDKKNLKSCNEETKSTELPKKPIGSAIKPTKSFECLDSNFREASKMVEKLNTSIDRIQTSHNNMSYTEEVGSLSSVRKIQKTDGCQQKLEYQSDNEDLGEPRSFTPKIEDLQEEDDRRMLLEENTARSPRALSNSGESQPRMAQQSNSTAGLSSINPLQDLGLNYTLNVLQNPLTSMLLQNTTKDLMALSKSLLLFSSITNSPGNLDKLATLLLDSGSNVTASDPNRLAQSQRGNPQTKYLNLA